MKIDSGPRHRPRSRRLSSLLLLLALLSGCDFDDVLPECDYNARIDFFYTLNDGGANVLPQHVSQITDYVFNAANTLIEIHQRKRQQELAYAGLQLAPGQYSLVSWGNAKDATTVVPAQIGVTRLDEMMLYLDHLAATARPVGDAPLAIHANADKLYYGACSLEVKPRGVSHARIDMAHSHCRLGITVKWKRGAPPDTQTYHMELRNIAGAYRFGSGKHEPGSTRVNHRLNTEMGITRSVRGEFVTLRLATADHPIFCLYADGKAVIKEIDLHKFFTTMQINLDRNTRQEFDLVMEVHPDGAVIVSSVKVSDWQEGESIGGGF